MDISPLRALRYDVGVLRSIEPPERAVAEAVTAPPYDVISPSQHAELLERSPYNVTRLTLGAASDADSAAGAVDYASRSRELERWLGKGVLRQDETPGFYVYTVDYHVPVEEASGRGAARRFHGLLALGRLHPFADGVVLPHEQTFPKVVDDRLQLLHATRTHLESIFLLYSDPERHIDAILEANAAGEPVVEVEAKPGERHALFRIGADADVAQLTTLFAAQNPIIADGHHRYTMGLRYRDELAHGDAAANWQLMTFANLFSDGLSILATHRMVKLQGMSAAEALERVLPKMEQVAAAEAWDMVIETASDGYPVRFPSALRSARQGVAATSYGLLQDVVLGDWLSSCVAPAGVTYFKEGTGERVALERGDGDVLFRMQPVGRDEFRGVVEGHEVFPHKTTYFYPKLWSGLALWRLGDGVN